MRILTQVLTQKITQYMDLDTVYGWKKAQTLLQDEQFEWEYDMSRHPGLEEHIERADGKDAYFIPILIPVKNKA